MPFQLPPAENFYTLISYALADMLGFGPKAYAAAAERRLAPAH